MVLIDDFIRDTHILPFHQWEIILCTLIDAVIDAHSEQRSHRLSGVISHGKLRRPPIETCREVPVLVRLEGEEIEQQLEIVHRGLANHIHMVFDLIAREAKHHLLHLVESTLHRITLRIVLMGRLATNRDVELHLSRKAWHKVIASTQL